MACAIEFIHSASVILDDLPAMDDATLRRGLVSITHSYGDVPGSALNFRVTGSNPNLLVDAGVKIDTRVDDRDASTALVEVCDDGDYDLLVVGNKGMTGASRFFLGSVPNKVSHHINRSLLIVRTT